MKATPLQQDDRVIESFQQTMKAFLDVQKTTMLAYLAGRNGHATSKAPAQPAEARPAPAAPATAPPACEHRSAPMTSDLPAPDRAADVDAGDSALPDRAAVTARLLETVRDRTGYPIETLGLDMDMEADLGIDSIKRVEILGKLRDEFPSLRSLSESAEAMDALARARTLGAIVEKMMSLTEQMSRAAAQRDPAARPAPPASTVNGNGRHHAEVRRRVLEVVAAPLPQKRGRIMAGAQIVIADNGSGLAGLLQARLASEGIAAEAIGGPDSAVDWTSPASIDAALEHLRRRGPLGGIVHTLALGSAARLAAGDSEWSWSARVHAEVKGLFLVAKAMAPELEAAARAGGACLIAAAALGGRFASAGCASADFFPGHGGIAGLVKTLAREWPLVRSRVVDFAATERAELVCQRLADEILADDEWAEVGYHRDRRIRLQTVECPLSRSGASFELKGGAPVLISGGARGITALAAAELARRWRPTLLIVGTTPLSSESELGDIRGGSEAEIKRALHARLRGEGRRGSPAEIEERYQALRRGREVAENLETLRQQGATVAYAQADVRDLHALAPVLENWRARHGEIAGLIHGAGLIQDKLIRDKSAESFDRVLATKLDGALNLIRSLRPEALEFTALFSSIAGRFGNAGQSDYAAANEILNKLAHWLDRRWPGRVVSVIWGPWSGVGMVSELEGHLGRRGLGMIAPEVGGSLLLDELRHGRKGEVEVIYSGELGTLEQPIRHQPITRPLPVETYS